jgi:hypothetical protein
MPRTGGGGMAMMKASCMDLQAHEQVAHDDCVAVMPLLAMRSAKGAKVTKIAAAFESHW